MKSTLSLPGMRCVQAAKAPNEAWTEPVVGMQPERYVYVNIDQEKLDAYGITLEQVGQVVSANNLNLSSGTIKMPQEQYQMQVRSERNRHP